MNGLMMDYSLTVPAILRRAESLFGEKEIVSRGMSHEITRYGYSDLATRVRKLAVGLGRLGVRPGDRVATLGWNESRHLEAYFAIPSIGAVLHTVNPRLHHDDIAYILNDAEDRILFIDQDLLPVYERIRDRVTLNTVVLMRSSGERRPEMVDYEELVTSGDAAGFREANIDERAAASMCYTSGTTGRPKGVVYSHRALALHSMACAMVDGLAIREADTILPVVPMFHINAWGLPFTAAMVGAKLVLPNRHLDPASLLSLLSSERVTFAAGVPTVWLAVLDALDADPHRYSLDSLRTILTGGSAAPPAMIKAFEQRHGLRVLHAWGMTETTPIGTVATEPSSLLNASTEVRDANRCKQGTPLPFIEVRGRSESGFIPWDGAAAGELEIRGPWVASSYYNHPLPDDRFAEDGWFRTGDVVSISPRGAIEIRDRTKDLVKSGGEWISSVALENALMGHPAVAEAAVIAVPHAKWSERPLAVVVVRPGHSVTFDELRTFLQDKFASWWLPDAVAFIDKLPRTAAGKFRKTELRERFREHYSGMNIAGQAV